MKVNSYGHDYEVEVNFTKYADGNLAVTMDYFDDEFLCWMPFARLTVNLGGRMKPGYAYLDVNNCPWAEEFVAEYGLGEPTGDICASGYCVYPLYKFDMEKRG